MAKRTPLYEEHLRLGGKIVEFGGWELPVQYLAGIKAEHLAVRKDCGLFDVSHMGEFELAGADAVAFLNHLLTNDYTNITDGRIRYSPMCNEEGGVVDDLLVYCRDREHFFIVVNAANTEKDFAWMKKQAEGFAVELTDRSDEFALLAFQGPKAEEILTALAPAEEIPAKYYTAAFEATVAGSPCILSRTGYTGEDGFEIYCAPEAALAIWSALLAEGEPKGLLPCGLGARDTLRLEAAMPLYGHEMDDTVSPLETGLSFFVKMDKEDFVGKKALLEKGEPAICRVGLAVTGRGIVRENETVFADGEAVGRTTSGTLCPSLEKAVAMALVKKEFAAEGTTLTVEVRGKEIETEVVPLPFYKRNK